MNHDCRLSRRNALGLAMGGIASLVVSDARGEKQPATTSATTTTAPIEPIIDIHQHTPYSGRSDAAMLHHQKVLGATQTILLPGGRPADRASTLHGRANGLEAAAGSYEVCMAIARERPGEYFFGANDVPDLEGAKDRMEAQLKAGAICIGEQKFNLPCDSKEMEMVYAIAQEFDVPILMHFQFQAYNTDYERFGNVLKKWPKVNFVGHAQTFWANIDANHKDQASLYPRGKVTPGGWTDRYLSDHENLWADMGAGSGLNAMTRDEEHARAFIECHQDRLLYGSDCSDIAGHGPTCTGSGQIACIRRLAPNKAAERKILYENAKALYWLPAPLP